MGGGPGGFEECILKRYPNIHVLGVSLKQSDGCEENLEYHPKLLNHERFLDCKFTDILKQNDEIIDSIKKISDDGIDFIIADGATSYEYETQEDKHFDLLRAELKIAKETLSLGGSFLLKCFGMFSMETRQEILKFGSNFQKVLLFKPSLSRVSNSEIYILFLYFEKLPVLNERVLNERALEMYFFTQMNKICRKQLFGLRFLRTGNQEYIDLINNENNCQKEIFKKLEDEKFKETNIISRIPTVNDEMEFLIGSNCRPKMDDFNDAMLD